MKFYRRLFYWTYRLIGRMDGEDSAAPVSAALFLSLCAILNVAALLAVVRGLGGIPADAVFARESMLGLALAMGIAHYWAFCRPARLAAVRAEFREFEVGAWEIFVVGGYAALSIGLFLGALALFR